MLRVYPSSPDTEPASLLFIWNSFGGCQGIGPPCDDGSYLGPFARIHVVCILNHDCIHATRAVQVPLGRGLKQFEVFLAPDVPVCPKKREDRTTDPCNSGIRSLPKQSSCQWQTEQQGNCGEPMSSDRGWYFYCFQLSPDALYTTSVDKAIGDYGR